MNTIARQVTISINELQQTLEPLIRRIIREELLRLSRQKNIFYLTPEMPLYADMEEISQRKSKNDITLSSHEEVWDE